MNDDFDNTQTDREMLQNNCPVHVTAPVCSDCMTVQKSTCRHCGIALPILEQCSECAEENAMQEARLRSQDEIDAKKQFREDDFGAMSLELVRAIHKRVGGPYAWPDDWEARWLTPTPFTSRVAFIRDRGATAAEMARLDKAWRAWR